MQPTTNPYQSFASSDVSQVQKEATPLSGWIVIGLMVGFIVLAMGAGLLHFVMAGLLGMVMVLAALLGLIVTGSIAFAVGHRPLWSRLVGFIIFLASVLVLMSIAGSSTLVASNYALVFIRGKFAPFPAYQLFSLMFFSMIPSVGLSLGLFMQGRLPRRRYLLIGLCTFAVIPMSLLFFQMFRMLGLSLTP